ncbi:putative chloride channel, voltage gated, chloride channel, core [Plasmopara halstedii]
MKSKDQRLRSASISLEVGPTSRPNLKLRSINDLRRRSSSPLVWSPWRRADSVMERIMNPFLDRESPSHYLNYKTALAPPPELQLANDNTPLLDPAAKQSTAAELLYKKSLAFHDGLHSTYVADYPKGLHGFFVLFESPLLLIAIGTFAGSVGLAIDMWSVQVARYHQWLGDQAFALFVLSACLAVSFSAILTHCLCPQAAGSGLPFMRVAISGIDMNAYLSFRCVATKIVGLMAALSAGLSIGKEGPFIMISCGFASVLMNWRPFYRIRDDGTKRLEMLACACAAGVAATFGSPFGGVLFGVEVTSHFYLVQTLPRSFFAAIVGALVLNFGTENTRYGLFGNRSMGISADTDAVNGSGGATYFDLIVFSMIGMVCGLGGALFNRSLSVLVRARDDFFKDSTLRSRRTWWDALGKRLGLTLIVTLLSCWLEFYGDKAWFLRHGSPRRILDALFSKEKQFFSADGINNPGSSANDSLLLSRSLLTFLPLKFILTLVSIVLPVPAGLFTPTLIIGGIFGRLVGEAVRAFGLWHTRFEPFEFAIIGAGAFSSGVTHAVSTAAIIMEISHTDGLNLPVSVAILAAYFTSKRFSENVYDVLIATSNLPRLKKLPKAAYDIPAWEVMMDVSEMGVLTADSTYGDALALLQRPEMEPVFPIVDSLDNCYLLATVTRSRLAYAISRCQRIDLTTRSLSPATVWQCANIETVPTAASSLTRSRSTVPKTFQALGYNPVSEPIVFAMYGAIDSSPCHGSEDSDDLKERVEDDIDELPMQLLTTPIHFAFKRGGKCMDWGTNEVCEQSRLTVLINPSPFQLMEMTPMRRVDMLFRMLKLNNVFVSRSGKLMGVISLERMMTFLGTTTPYQAPGLLRTLKNFCS